MKQLAIIKAENAGTLAQKLQIPFNLLGSRSELRIELDPEQSNQEKLVARDARVMQAFGSNNLSGVTAKVITTL